MAFVKRGLWLPSKHHPLVSFPSHPTFWAREGCYNKTHTGRHGRVEAGLGGRKLADALPHGKYKRYVIRGEGSKARGLT
ncbi:hypothetical protein Acr_20g0009630 [Actinidia rufa]|uniref:Uncharacterized protein n=1 Tax=Actinidia rufa TaxID=165716 RepID=A0A7J0GEG7_9ERIC|nr:hypothetical protein Acr_20g0009630 [Actinidia rufa]